MRKQSSKEKAITLMANLKTKAVEEFYMNNKSVIDEYFRLEREADKARMEALMMKHKIAEDHLNTPF